MSYSTLDDLRALIPGDILIQLTDDESTGAVVASRVAEAIAQADGEIDSYCAGKYAVPFAVVPAVIKKCSVDMAIYNLYSRRVEELPPVRADRYRNALRCLEGIAKGTISPGVDPEPTAATGGDRIRSTKIDTQRAATRKKLKGF
jgi:phage gp36-like protein